MSQRRAPVSPALSRLRTAFAKLVSAAGQSTGVVVYDLNAGATLFQTRAAVKRAPASVEKLFTSVALLRKFGAGARLHTAILGSGHLGPNGVWHGDLYLRGDGDPTFGDGAFNRTWEQGYGPTPNDLVAQLRAAGIRRVTGQVIGDESLFDARRGGPNSGFAPDIPDLGGQLSALAFDHGSTGTGRLSPAAFAARQLVLTMRGSHIAAQASPATAAAPAEARPLATVTSPPLRTLVRLMDVPSDDFFAELLTKLLGARFGRGGTTAAGARVIHHVLVTGYGVHPTIIDGSGLSRGDRSSPLEVLSLLKRLWRTPVGNQLAAALPTAGVNGTLHRIGRGTAAQGVCVAKTGTLNGVTNLAGYCRSRGHHTLAFALFIDGPANWVAVPMLSKMVAAIARY